ncbi:MAG TPA: 50S ribosomal protein L4 [Candidatus Baltobacteraceae bacterium]|nr:50S ribosomal protein L4 [Candidatus Baltobacteraceae bacterium]
MATANVLTIEGTNKGTVELPKAFSEAVRQDLINRAVVAERSYELQPQGHYPLAGQQTTATYYGAMHSYRTGRHMGKAIRPREKLGGGVQGKVKVVPSAVKGKRAHPHLVEKILIERINKREYQKALASAISATAKDSPLIVEDRIEEVKRSKEMVGIFNKLKLSAHLERSRKPTLKKGLRRSTKQRHYKRSVLLVVSKISPAMKSARNIAGVDVCTVFTMRANLLAPGGNPGRVAVWSESAIKQMDSAMEKYSLN